MVRRPWCWERLRAGEEGGNRGKEGWMASWLNRHEFEQSPGDSEDRVARCAAVPGVTESWIWLGDWTAKGKKFLDRFLKQLLSIQQGILNYDHYIVHYYISRMYAFFLTPLHPSYHQPNSYFHKLHIFQGSACEIIQYMMTIYIYSFSLIYFT